MCGSRWIGSCPGTRSSPSAARPGRTISAARPPAGWSTGSSSVTVTARGIQASIRRTRDIGNPFGDRSVIEFADYCRARLGRDSARWRPGGHRRRARSAGPDDTGPLVDPHRPESRRAGAAVGGSRRIGARERRRTARLGDLALYGPAKASVLLLDPAPGCRDAWYSANEDYADDEVDVLLAAVRTRVAVSGTVGLGISLGALATLALQRRRPDAYDAVVLQSGSFFTPQTDPQESGYGQFDQVCRAVRSIKATRPARPVPALITCGAIEENLLNNIELAQALRTQGYGVEWKVVGDAHTMTGWRDAWAPELDQLIDLV